MNLFNLVSSEILSNEEPLSHGKSFVRCKMILPFPFTDPPMNRNSSRNSKLWLIENLTRQHDSESLKFCNSSSPHLSYLSSSLSPFFLTLSLSVFQMALNPITSPLQPLYHCLSSHGPSTGTYLCISNLQYDWRFGMNSTFLRQEVHVAAAQPTQLGTK